MRVSVIETKPDYGATKTGRIYSRKSGKWKELKPQPDTDGYLQVRLFNNGTNKLTFVHRIVAEMFLDKPLGCTEVNHKDGHKKNNNYRNLEWCTRQDNMLHAHNMSLISTQTPIVATNVQTGTSMLFKGQHDAARKLGIDQGNINHALKRHNGTSKGYRFEYLTEEEYE